MMCKTFPYFVQVAENDARKKFPPRRDNCVDRLSDNTLYCPSMKRRPRKPGELAPGEIKVTFIASPYDQKVIKAGLQKHNLKRKSEIVRMALKRFAEYEKFEIAS